MIVGLTSTQGTARIHHWVVLSILLHLLQYSTQAVFGCVHFQQKGSLQICKCQDRCHGTFLFQCVEGFFGGSHKCDRMILQFTVSATQQIIQQLGYSCEALYEVVEVSHGSNKLSNSSVHCWGSHPCNLLNALLSGEHTLGRDLMAQVCYFLFEEVAFRWLELQPVVSKVIEDGLKPCEVVLWHF